MANETETETTASHSASEERPQRMPVFPARTDETAGGNGSDVPAQYKAIHEAQLLHEETIRQIREELRAYKKRLSELSDGAAGQKPGHMDAVLLRLSELERKIGQGAPDPLLNEIVHRLASLESSGAGRGGNDPRVEGLLTQVESLRRDLSDPAPADPRTDDVVLRIAAMEGALRRAQQELSPDRIEDLERLVSESGVRVQELIDQRLGGVEQDIARTAREAAEAVNQKVDALERQLEAAVTAGSLEALEARLSEIEQSVQQQPDASTTVLERFQTIEGRLGELADAAVLRSDLAGLEQKLEELELRPDDDLGERLESRLAAVESRQPAPDPRIDELAVRLSTVEGAASGADSETIQDLVQQVGRIELQLPRPEQQQQWDERLAEIESKWEAARSDSHEFGAVAARVEALESHGTKVFESRLTELTARLRAVELKGEGAGAEDPRVDRLAERLDQLELTGASGDTARQLSELRERVADLQTRNKADLEVKLEEALSRLSTLEAGPGESDETAALVEQFGRRVEALEQNLTSGDATSLAALEQRLAELESRPSAAVADDPRVAAVERQLVSIRAELGGLRSTAEQTGADDRLDALAKQLEELRETAQGGEELAELRQRVEALVTAESAPDGVWREMAVRIEELERQAAGDAAEGSESVASTDLLQRLDRIESRLDERSEHTVSTDAFERIIHRLDFVENNIGQGGETSSEGVSDSFGAELASRFELVDRRLAEVESAGGAGQVSEALQQESERWSQWARGTLEEVGELRRQVEEIQEQGGSGEPGVSQQLLGTLSEKIASGLAGSEIKAVQNHVYRLYFAVFLLVGMVLTSLMLNK